MLLLQTTKIAKQAADAVENLLEDQEQTLSIYEMVVDGGIGSIIIISVLFVLLAVALYIYFERLFAIKAASKIDKNFMNQIRDNVSSGKLDAAKMLCAQTDSPVARLTEKGISRIGKPL
jgi:biopolymer transport protein ExbB